MCRRMEVHGVFHDRLFESSTTTTSGTNYKEQWICFTTTRQLRSNRVICQVSGVAAWCATGLAALRSRRPSISSFVWSKTYIKGMDSASKVTLFEDIFEVVALNPDGYRFENVNRIQATGTTFECDLLLDINCKIYKLKDSEKFTAVIASTLHLDGSPADHFSYTRHNGEPDLSDNYEYVMHGRVFDYERKANNETVISISFGGLLMRLTGDHKHLASIAPDQRLFLLIKKD